MQGDYQGPDKPKRSREALKYVERPAVLRRLWKALESVGVTEANVGRNQLFRVFDVLCDAYDAGAEGNPLREFVEWTATADPFPEWTGFYEPSVDDGGTPGLPPPPR